MKDTHSELVQLLNVQRNWASLPLENCVDILDNQRVPINSVEREHRKGDIPYYGATGQVGWIDDYLFDEELILLGEDGAPFLDKHKIKAYIINGKSWVNNHAHVLRANTSITNNSYVCHYLNYFNYNGYVNGTTRLKLNQSQMKKIPVKLAPLNEQKRIVSKLEELFTKLDAGIEYLKKTQILLKQYRQSVLKHAFEGKLTEKWREENRKKIEHPSLIIDNIYQLKDGSKKKQNLKLIKDNLIKIPKDWIWTTVGDIAQSMKNGIYKPPQFYNEKGIACLRMYNIEDGNLIWKDIKRMDLTKAEIKEYELNPGDILVNRVNSRELVGKAATIPYGLEPCVYESKNIRLRVFDKFINSKLVSSWFLLSGQRYFNSNAQQTVGMASINQVQLGAMPIPLMSIEEQELIIREIERRLSITFHNLKNIETYFDLGKHLRQSILQIAFSGKLVFQDVNDEPAEILLQKIKKERESDILIKEKSKIPKKKSIDDGKQMRLM